MLFLSCAKAESVHYLKTLSPTIATKVANADFEARLPTWQVNRLAWQTLQLGPPEFFGKLLGAHEDNCGPTMRAGTRRLAAFQLSNQPLHLVVAKRLPGFDRSGFTHAKDDMRLKGRVTAN